MEYKDQDFFEDDMENYNDWKNGKNFFIILFYRILSKKRKETPHPNL